MTANMEGDILERVEFNSPPSLQHIATLHTAIALWQQNDVTDAIKSFINANHPTWLVEREWHKVESLVSGNIHHLGLANSLAREVSYAYRSIGAQILDWSNKRNRLFKEAGCVSCQNNFWDNLRWTVRGIVDARRTAQFMLANPDLAVTHKFRLACKNCLEDSIVSLWSQMPGQSQGNFCSAPVFREHKLVLLWANVLTGNVATLQRIVNRFHTDVGEILITENRISCYEWVFKWFAREDDAVAAEYFWTKLTDFERNEVLRWASAKWSTLQPNAAIFLLSRMDGQQQKEIFKKHAKMVLKCLFSDWSYREFLAPTIAQMWEFLDEKLFIRMLTSLCTKDNKIIIDIPIATSWYPDMGSHCHEDDKYRVTFGNLWCSSPIHLRKSIFVNGWNLLWELLKLEDLANLKLVLSDGTDEEKRNLINSESGQNVLIKVLGNGRVQLVDFFLRNVLSSVDEITQFKKDLRRQKLTKEISDLSRYHFNEFNDWLNESEEKLEECRKQFCESDHAVSLFTESMTYKSWDKLFLLKQICFPIETDFLEFRKRLLSEINDEGIVECIAAALINDNADMYELNQNSTIQTNTQTYQPWSQFNRLMNFILPTENEANQFKRDMMLARCGAEKVCRLLLSKGELSLATVFLKWLFVSDAEIAKFKQQLWSSNKGLYPFYHKVLNIMNVDRALPNEEISYQLASIKYMLNWYEPSQEIMSEFRFLLIRHFGADKSIIDKMVSRSVLEQNLLAAIEFFDKNINLVTIPYSDDTNGC